MAMTITEPCMAALRLLLARTARAARGGRGTVPSGIPDTTHGERMAVLGNLAGAMAHDFNNVLQSILVCTALLIEKAGDRDGVEILARLVEDAASRGHDATSRLLAFSRAEPYGTGATVEVTPVLEGLASILSRMLGPGGEVMTRAQSGMPAAKAGRARLETALFNLAINARDAMPGGGSLTMSANLDGPFVEVTVADTGAGMDRETLARAVEPFFTTKGPGEGNGLGLHIVATFARDCGGTMSVTSERGRGTEVTLRLPVAA